VDTSGVSDEEALASSTATGEPRADEPTPPLPASTVLGAAPRTRDGYVRVPPFLGEDA
jgi:Asp-tRNA(Asn)/Glu-tRNA(Gln) amidotransferase C subunit